MSSACASPSRVAESKHRVLTSVSLRTGQPASSQQLPMTASQGVSQDLPTRTVDVICPALADFSQEAAIAVLAILGARPGRDSRIGKPGPQPTAQGSLRGHRRAARCFSGRAAALLSQSSRRPSWSTQTKTATPTPPALSSEWRQHGPPSLTRSQAPVASPWAFSAPGGKGC